MKTHHKITILLVAVTGILIIMVVLFQNIQRQQYELYLRSKFDSDREVINKVMEFKAEGFMEPTIDNSAWDEMVDFVSTKEMVWAEENMGSSIITFNFSYVGVYDLGGNKIYSVADSTNNDFQLTQGQVKDWFSGKKTIHTFLVLNSNLFEIFGAVIVPSYDISYQTKGKGYLITVKSWDQRYIRELEKATGFRVLILPGSKTPPPPEVKSNETIYLPLTDGKNKDVVLLQFSKENKLINELKVLKYFTISGLIFFLVVIFLFSYLIRRWLMSPLKNITQSLISNDLKPIEYLFGNKSEFGEIANIIKQYQNQKNDLINEVTERTEVTEKFRALLKAQPDLMFIIDRVGTFYEYYAPSDEMLFLQPEEFLGKRISEIFPHDLSKIFQDKIDELELHRMVEPLEYDLDVPYGKQSFEARFISIYNERILCVIRDISNRKKSEKELMLAKGKAEESDRLKSAFLANMSHEIRTPMNQILGFTELLEDETITADERRQFRAIVKRSGGQLLNIINDILDLSRIESNQVEIQLRKFNLNQFLDEILTAFENEQSKLEKSEILLQLVKPVTDTDAMILSDDFRLRQILNNLIGNALKFTSRGYIRFGYKVNGEELVCFVEDTGKGISGDKHELIFDRFRQEEESYTRHFGGTGLGLSICKGLVELLGGRIWVKSEEGQGSTFFFTLDAKLFRAESIPSFEQSPVTKNYHFKGKTILVAEDVDENIELIQRMLKKTEVTIIPAEDGSRAVEICQSHNTIDIVLMDIQMPVINGYEATKKIRIFRPDLTIIAMTAYANTEDKLLCLNAGCTDFISKPVSKQNLLKILGKYLAPNNED